MEATQAPKGSKKCRDCDSSTLNGGRFCLSHFIAEGCRRFPSWNPEFVRAAALRAVA